MVLSSAEAEYLVLTQAAEIATRLRLLVTELGLLKPDQQYVQINISTNNIYVEVINDGFESIDPGRASFSISFKSNNQGTVLLAYNPVFYITIKHIDI